MKALQTLSKVVAAIPKIIDVLSLAHNMLNTLLGHINGTAPVQAPAKDSAPAE